MSDWSDEETNEPLFAENRNFHKVETSFSGISLDKARRIFDRMINHRPRAFTLRCAFSNRARLIHMRTQ